MLDCLVLWVPRFATSMLPDSTSYYLVSSTSHNLTILLLLVLVVVLAVAAVADITTKDLLTDKHLCSDPPCCPGTRNPRLLLHSWQAMCCTPIAYRPYRGWRQLPTDDAAAEMAVTGLV